MSLVTTKLQVTLPKAIADKYQIRPGDEIEWIEAGDGIRVVPAKTLPPRLGTRERLRLFDEATSRQREREAAAEAPRAAAPGADRGWTREEIYDRGRAR
jgi:AbrB family looped-hinge helix DNA binding protein